MFGCWSRELICAAATNVCANDGLSEKPGNTRLIATRRENPSAPSIEPRNTSAIPPPPSRVSRRYFPDMPSIAIFGSIDDQPGANACGLSIPRDGAVRDGAVYEARYLG